MRHGGDASVLQGQMQALGGLLKRVGRAGPEAFAAVSAAVADAVVQARTAADQRVATAATSAHMSRELMEASASARESVNSFLHDFYEAKKFDPYLRFNSPEDEQDYRRREAENQRAIREATAKDTPEGNLEAAALARRQVADAGAHGADKSPEWAGMKAGLDRNYATLQREVQRNGGDTSRADAITSAPPTEPLPEPESTKAATSARASELDDVLATLQSAGVTTLLDTPAASGHGLSHRKPNAETPARGA